MESNKSRMLALLNHFSYNATIGGKEVLAIPKDNLEALVDGLSNIAHPQQSEGVEEGEIKKLWEKDLNKEPFETTPPYFSEQSAGQAAEGEEIGNVIELVKSVMGEIGESGNYFEDKERHQKIRDYKTTIAILKGLQSDMQP